jgi:hypothetical protein
MRIIAFMWLLLNVVHLNAQVYIGGVLNSKNGHQQAGDTIVLAGTYQDPETQLLYYYEKGTDEKVPADKVSLLLSGVNFWDVQQFYYITHKGNCKTQ